MKNLKDLRYRANISMEVIDDNSCSRALTDYDLHFQNSSHHIDEENLRFYSGNNRIKTMEEYRKYIRCQQKRSISKLQKQRSIEHYRVVADAVKNLPFWDEEEAKKINMICLGARNSWEAKCFKKLLKVQAKALDIQVGPNSEIDYLMDFNLLPEEWEKKWNIVFSNSIDHAEDPTYTFFEWLRVLQQDGLMILGISGEEKEGVDGADCSFLSEESVEKFINDTALVNILVKLPKAKEVTYAYYLLQKI